MAGDPSLYDEIERAIGLARLALPSRDGGGEAEDAETWSAADQEQLRELSADHDLLEAHRRKDYGHVVAVSEPNRCAACGQARACDTTRDLAARYGAAGRGDDEPAPRSFTREQMQSDKVGQCACGLALQQNHARVSRPGEPELYVRGSIHCIPTRPGPHFRVD
jgi:hypothetical protein